ncbi:MAG: thiol oxidoreductase [Planctomycetes bacterium]|nr:thiol oxidoreductase [Planctomycetota bacterium]
MHNQLPQSASRSFLFLLALSSLSLSSLAAPQALGEEVSVPTHLAPGEEHQLPLRALVRRGREIFKANWTVQEGGGRPLTDGTGAQLVDQGSPLVGMRAFNRVSGPDANSCYGCHNAPDGLVGGGGDIVANVFVLGQRFDFATFDNSDLTPTRGCVDELGAPATLQNIGNSRATLGMSGAGYIEMLARQITSDLRARRDSIPPAGGSVNLVSKGISFGVLSRNAAGFWDVSQVVGLPPPSVATAGGTQAPDLTVRPFHQAGAVISLRQFSNNAMNHHHGLQTVERFGASDVDGDGYASELSVGDVTAVTVFQAVVAAPGRVIPDDPAVEQAVRLGEELFASIGCVQCHTPCLSLVEQGWVFSEPNPYNPAGNLRPSDAYVQQFGTFSVDLASPVLPMPRLRPRDGVVHVHAFTDFRLHDITSGPNDPNREALNMHAAPGSQAFFAGNSHFLTKKLWGAANEPPYFHHGQFTTLRQAIEAHAGEASASRAAWNQLDNYGRASIIEFLKTLQVLPEGAKHLIVNEHGEPKSWPPFPGCNH